MFTSTTQNVVIFIIIVTLLMLLIIAFSSILIYNYQRRKLDYQNGINELTSRYESDILKSKIKVQEQTFQNISREIHDNIGQKLTLAKLHLNQIDEIKAGQISTEIRDVVAMLTDSISDLRDLSRSMSSDHIAQFGFVKALENEIFHLNKTIHHQVTLRVTGESVFFSTEKEIIIFRIIQEALTNIVKHAAASKILLDLHFRSDLFFITIQDNGRGFSLEKVIDSNGINNIISRAETLKGSTNFHSILGQGTTLTIKIPYNEE